MATTKGCRVRLRQSAASKLPHAGEAPFRETVICRDCLAIRHRDAAEVAA